MDIISLIYRAHFNLLILIFPNKEFLNESHHMLTIQIAKTILIINLETNIEKLCRIQIYNNGYTNAVDKYHALLEIACEIGGKHFHKRWQCTMTVLWEFWICTIGIVADNSHNSSINVCVSNPKHLHYEIPQLPVRHIFGFWSIQEYKLMIDHSEAQQLCFWERRFHMGDYTAIDKVKSRIFHAIQCQIKILHFG